MIGKLIGKVVAAPVKAMVSLPDTLADIVHEVGGAIEPTPKPRSLPSPTVQRVTRPR